MDNNCYNDPVMYRDPDGNVATSILTILDLIAIVVMGLTIGGVVNDNNIMTAIGLIMVTVSVLICGGTAIATIWTISCGVLGSIGSMGSKNQMMTSLNTHPDK